MVENGYAMEARWTWWSRLMYRLFPPAPRPRIDGDARTFLTTNIYVSVDWRDRVRLLVSGRAFIQVVTYTDIEVQQAESVSAFSVEAPHRGR